MWIEIVVIFIIWLALVWMILTLLEQMKTKKLKRGYDIKNDPGRKKGAGEQTGFGYRTSSSFAGRKSDIQDAIVDAKRELLQSGAGGSDNNISEPASDDK